jgi:hypothetical protein
MIGRDGSVHADAAFNNSCQYKGEKVDEQKKLSERIDMDISKKLIEG